MTEPEGEQAPYFVTAVERGMAVLQAFTATRPRLTYTEAGELTGLSRATTRRLMLTFRDLGFLESPDGKTFGLTPRVLQLGYSYLSTLPLREVARPQLEELSADLQETAGLAILDGEEIVYVAIAMSPRLTSVRINLGTRFPARETAAGRVLLAHRGREYPEIRAAGYCVLDGELGEDLRGVAAPVPEAQGVSAAVGVSLHSGRQDVADLTARFAPAVVAAAERIAGAAR